MAKWLGKPERWRDLAHREISSSVQWHPLHPSPMAKARAPDHLRRIYSTLAKTLLAGRRVDFAFGLGRLRDRRKSGAIASGAFDFCRHIFCLSVAVYLNVSKGNDRSFSRAAATAQQSADFLRPFSETTETQAGSF
jgi:hypothetical protein